MVAELRSKRSMSARRRDDELLPIDRIGHRRGLTAGAKAVLPELFAGAAVIGADVVVLRRRQKCDAARAMPC